MKNAYWITLGLYLFVKYLELAAIGIMYWRLMQWLELAAIMFLVWKPVKKMYRKESQYLRNLK